VTVLDLSRFGLAMRVRAACVTGVTVVTGTVTGSGRNPHGGIADRVVFVQDEALKLNRRPLSRFPQNATCAASGHKQLISAETDHSNGLAEA
jgi:hypothetical protein